jgi:hypothetical protein
MGWERNIERPVYVGKYIVGKHGKTVGKIKAGGGSDSYPYKP